MDFSVAAEAGVSASFAATHERVRARGGTKMMQLARIAATIILVGAIATTGYSQPGAMTPEQMKTMGDQMRTMGNQMRSGKMTQDQMKMMGEHMQMMADRMKSGQMTADEMKMMNEHMKMMREHMKMGGQMKGKK
jgi:hypothetical protein